MKSVVKIAPRHGGHQVYWFITEDNGRSYGGRIIGYFNDFGVAMKKAEQVAGSSPVVF